MLFSDRFPQGSRSLASGSGVRGEEESAKPDRRSLIPSIEDITISTGKHSQRMNSVKNSDKIKELIAHYGPIRLNLSASLSAIIYIIFLSQQNSFSQFISRL